jgi:L-alanine-DL-glutamate epimerase-like enolase superfamily enzyme
LSPNLTVSIEEYPLLTPFRIARGIRSAATVVVASIKDGHLVGCGECTPYARYGETPESVCRTIMQLRDPILRGIDRSDLQTFLPPGGEMKLSGEAKVAAVAIEIQDLAPTRSEPALRARTVAMSDRIA